MQNSIKICYILPEYNEETDTHFYHHYEFIKELSKKTDVFLIAEKGNIKNVGHTMSYIMVQKFKFLPLRFLESFFLILKARRKGYKIFYTHYCYISGINAAIVSRLFGGKSYYWNCAMNWLFKQKTLQGLAYRLCLRWSHYLVTGSEEMKRGYSGHYNLPLNKIKVMPNWINPNRFKSQKLKVKSQNTILFVHWLSKRKGADMIIPIANQLSKILTTKYKLLIVGDGPCKEQLLQEIKDNNLENYIEVLGAIPNKNLPEYYAKADLFIMPSMEEGFPRVLLEAMASGIPYVATDVGAVREISPEIAQRFLVKPGDPEKFAQKIEILINDEKIYNEFKEEELKKIKEYSLDKVINKFRELFK